VNDKIAKLIPHPDAFLAVIRKSDHETFTNREVGEEPTGCTQGSIYGVSQDQTSHITAIVTD
jgi:hypothetical protein